MSSTLISSGSIVCGWIASISTLIFLIVIGNVVFCYYSLSRNNIEAIMNRRPSVVLIVGVLTCFYLFLWIFLPLGLFGIFGAADYNAPLWATCALMSVLLTLIPALYLLLYRGYRVYYDMKFNEALQDLSWRLYIDPTERNWYLKQKKKWGEGKMILIILSIIYLLLAFLAIGSSILRGKNDKKARYLTTLNLLIPIISSMILYCKFPKFDDIWKIRKESKLLSLLSSILTISYLLFGVISGVQPPEPLYIIFVFMANFLSICLIGSTMFYVLIKFNLPTNIYSYNKYIKSATDINTVYHLDNRKRRDSLTITMNDILQTENGFNLFARHLTKEFAVEHLLFFVETQQWINYILSFEKHQHELVTLDDDDHQFRFDTLFNIKFPSNAPKSKIIESTIMNVDGVVMNVDGTVSSTKNDKIDQQNQQKQYNDNDIDENVLYISSVKIFKKYIIEHAYFAINISSEQRLNLYNLFGGTAVHSDINKIGDTEMVSNLKKNNINLKKLMHIFNEARYEAYKLMKGGFSRFKISEEFVSNFEKLANKI